MRSGNWPAMACQIFSGVRGMSRWRIPRWARASMTALWAAGMAAIVPASPMPFTPRGFWSVGVSVVWASNEALHFQHSSI